MPGSQSPIPEARTVVADLANVVFDDRGLVTAVVQHIETGEVLMVGWMSREALASTVGSRLVTFHSRSRGRLWTKGETSGNVLRLQGIRLDCDGDTLLVLAEPTGPVCHTGNATCFAGRELDLTVGPVGA